MKKVVEIYNKATDIINGHFSGWLIVIMMCVVLVEVITRYVARHPLGAADELSGMLMVVISFMAIGYTWKERRHIRLSFVVNQLPRRVAQWIRLIVLAGTLVFVCVLSRACFEKTVNSWKLGTKSYDLVVPVAWFQMFMFIGSVLLALWVLIDLIKTAQAIRSGEGGET